MQSNNHSKDIRVCNFEDIDKIVIKNSFDDKISLTKISGDKLESRKKFKEVAASNVSLISGNITQSGLQFANKSQTLSQIYKNAPNGLYKATTNPAYLSKFANGTTSTMVHKSGNLVGHKGFEEVILSNALNPAMLISAGMQAMATISGTYYLQKINIQLLELDAKLEKIINMLHDANIGRVIAAGKGLSEIATRERVDSTDLTAIRSYRKTLDEIQEEYMYSLKQLASKFYSENSKEEIDELIFKADVAFEANKLSLLAELIEITTRIKIGGQTELIVDFAKQLQRNYINSFYHNYFSEIEKIFLPLQTKTSSARNNAEIAFEKNINRLSKVNFSSIQIAVLTTLVKGVLTIKSKQDLTKATNKLTLETSKLNEAKTNIKKKKESDNLDSIIEEVIAFTSQEKDVILVIDEANNKNRIFIPE